VLYRLARADALGMVAIVGFFYFGHFGDPDDHMLAALGEYASWGYFDPGRSDYVEGYQCPPVNWGINTERKRQFFTALKTVTGS
jgi:hypothetical protein